LTETTLRLACGGAPERLETSTSSSAAADAVAVSLDALPGVLKRVGCSATARTVLDAITSLDAFLSDLDTTAITLPQVLAIYRYHRDFKASMPPDAVAENTALELASSGKSEELTNDVPLSRSKKEFTREGRFTNESLVLPSVSNIGTVPLSDKDIFRSFQRFDITGDKKLTFLGLKSALELHNDSNKVSDSDIREWLRANDRGGKGYVDLDDYKRIYSHAQKGGTRGPSSASDTYPNSREDILKK
jgi:hypothetical protein